MKKVLAIILIVILVLLQIPAFSASYTATVTKNDVRLRNPIGAYLVTIPKGMIIEVQRYDRALDMFYIVCEKPIPSEDNSEPYQEGYIKGTGLDISRDQLIKEMTATPKPKPTQIPTATPTATPIPTATPKPVMTEAFGMVGIGNIVSFGKYEQDGDMSNGSEPIEWFVLNIKDNQALLISKYALDYQPYNRTYSNTPWDKCTLREWLNESFLNSAFGEEQQKAIMVTSLDSNSNNTSDKVFLLSSIEAWMYLDSVDTRKCAPTEYAIQQGATQSGVHKVDGRLCCKWWLRSSAVSYYQGECVGYTGTRSSSLNSDEFCGVRPALWINLK